MRLTWLATGQTAVCIARAQLLGRSEWWCREADASRPFPNFKCRQTPSQELSFSRATRNLILPLCANVGAERVMHASLSANGLALLTPKTIHISAPIFQPNTIPIMGTTEPSSTPEFSRRSYV